MVVRNLKFTVFVLAVGYAALLPGSLLAQGNGSGMVVSTPLSGGLTRSIAIVDLDLYIKGPNGQPIEGPAVVTLTKLNGEFYRQSTAKEGYLRINEAAQSEYNFQVVAPGYGRITKRIDMTTSGTKLMKVTIQLEPAPEGEDAFTDLELAAMSPKAQKAIGKAIESLRNNKLPDARNQLATAFRVAPNNAEVNYLYGVYALQSSDRVQAKSYWIKALEIYPNHYRALLSISQALLDEKKPDEALVYLKRAVRSDPSSWRAHAISADAYLRQGFPDEAIKEAERALELGHGQAAVVQRYLAAALAKRGEGDKAVSVLQSYVQEHPADSDAKKQLENLQTVVSQNALGAASPEMLQPGTLAEATALPLPSSWLPPDVDEKIPPVESGASCAVAAVVEGAGKRIQEFVGNLDRFTATESIFHESINKWGLPSSPETRKFNYVASIEEVRPGIFNLDEYRNNGTAHGEFPEGIATSGLPGLAMIFHPHSAGNFDMVCEGLAQWDGRPAWQIHFRQRADKPNTLRSYKSGLDGQSHPVPMKGRAWIDAKSYQIVRLETDLVSPVPEIRLLADHTAIDYGPVQFRENRLELWLPRNAEVFFSWKAHRIHRRHSFSNYLLFSVDDKQKISAPKSDEPIGTGPGASKP